MGINQKIKLAMVASYFDRNGISTVILNYCEHLDLNKFDITIIAGEPVDDGLYQQCLENGIKVEKMPSKYDSSKKFYIELYRTLKRGQYQIVHVHGNSATMAMELGVAWLAKCPIRIAHSHNTTCSHQRAHKLLWPLFSRLYTHAFACGEEAGRWLFREKPFTVLPNAFETQKFKFDSNARKRVRKKLNLENKFVLGHIGKFNDQKNHPFLLNVFDCIAQRREDAVLLLIGGGPDEEAIKNQAEQSPYCDRIIFYGETNNSAEMYSVMDAFVFPSKFEGLGIVAVEAQISGLPCFVSDTVPKKITIGNNVSFLSLNDSYDQWADTIVKCNMTSEKREDFYKTNEKEIMTYDIQYSIGKLENIYLNACEEK